MTTCTHVWSSWQSSPTSRSPMPSGRRSRPRSRSCRATRPSPPRLTPCAKRSNGKPANSRAHCPCCSEPPLRPPRPRHPAPRPPLVRASRRARGDHGGIRVGSAASSAELSPIPPHSHHRRRREAVGNTAQEKDANQQISTAGNGVRVCCRKRQPRSFQ